MIETTTPVHPYTKHVNHALGLACAYTSYSEVNNVQVDCLISATACIATVHQCAKLVHALVCLYC